MVLTILRVRYAVRRNSPSSNSDNTGNHPVTELSSRKPFCACFSAMPYGRNGEENRNRQTSQKFVIYSEVWSTAQLLSEDFIGKPTSNDGKGNCIHP
ncbi:hypothetical protein M0804_007433 [Polistes exclamans]|nr:hypothetical protein M0804_007433 [Polistes exclamans]